MVHLFGKIWNQPGVEERVWITHVHIDIIRKRPVNPDKDTVMIKAGLEPTPADCVQMNDDLV